MFHPKWLMLMVGYKTRQYHVLNYAIVMYSEPLETQIFSKTVITWLRAVAIASRNDIGWGTWAWTGASEFERATQHPMPFISAQARPVQLVCDWHLLQLLSLSNLSLDSRNLVVHTSHQNIGTLGYRTGGTVHCIKWTISQSVYLVRIHRFPILVHYW